MKISFIKQQYLKKHTNKGPNQLDIGINNKQ